MNRIALHLRFFFGSAVLARVLTWLLVPILEAGHASVVAGVFPGLLLGHVIFGPAVTRVEHTPAGTFAAFMLSIGAFMLSSVVAFWVGDRLLWDRIDGVLTLLYLTAASVLIVSSALLEFAWRIRRRDEAAAPEPN